MVYRVSTIDLLGPAEHHHNDDHRDDDDRSAIECYSVLCLILKVVTLFVEKQERLVSSLLALKDTWVVNC